MMMAITVREITAVIWEAHPISREKVFGRIAPSSERLKTIPNKLLVFITF
jgi:hypothetical protein